MENILQQKVLLECYENEIVLIIELNKSSIHNLLNTQIYLFNQLQLISLDN